MHSRFTRIFGFAAMTVGLGLTAATANAQQAKFHLPFEAHWGSAVLEPGDYRLSTQVGASPSHIVSIYGDRTGNMVLPQSLAILPDKNDDNHIGLVNVNGEYFVREYKSGSTGRLFTFGLPKAAREGTHTLSSAIPVESADK